MVAPAASSFCTTAACFGRRRGAGEPVRIAAAGALAGDGVHVLDHGAQARERAAARALDRRLQVVRDEEAAHRFILGLLRGRDTSRGFSRRSSRRRRASTRISSKVRSTCSMRCGYAGQIGMHGDRHDLRRARRIPRRGSRTASIERSVDLVGRMILQRHHHDVVQLEIVGQGDHRLVRGLQRHRLVVEHPVADIFDAGLASDNRACRRSASGRARTSRAARLPAELLDHVHRLVDRPRAGRRACASGSARSRARSAPSPASGRPATTCG